MCTAAATGDKTLVTRLSLSRDLQVHGEVVIVQTGQQFSTMRRKLAMIASWRSAILVKYPRRQAPVNSMWRTGTITAKQKVRQKVPGLYAVSR